MTDQGIKYAHTNLVARDWRKLADFYIQVFNCQPVPPQRDHHGEWFQRVTNIPGARLQGLHLRLPGYDQDGPTLEVFQFEQELPASLPALNQPGFAHIAFNVADIALMREKVLAAGGSDLGEVVRKEIPDAGRITLVYLRDPEGNIVELQTWE